jgi:hypothetical protein
MKRSFRLAAVFAALLAVSACTNSGMDVSGLQPLRAEQAASANPPPPPGTFTEPAVTPAPADAAAAGLPVAASAPAPAATPGPVATPGPLAAVSTSARIQFAPVIGATPASVTPLAARLTARAAQRGIAVAQGGDTATTHVLKGYFSSFTEQRETTVIYVWDVLDPAGNRLHRIQGQQKVTGAQGEGWNSVTPQVMEAIADRTIDDLATWLASRSG